LLGRLGVGLFAREFFPHYCSRPPSTFHYEMYDLLTGMLLGGGGKRVAVAAPRESAKSTISTMLLPLWCILYPEAARKRYILIASDTATQAERHLGDIKIELEANELLAESFGEMAGAGPVWKKEEIVAASGVKLTARGTGGNIRGLRHRQYRPDLLIGDDLENDVNSQTPEQREKIIDWFFKAFSKTGGKNVDIVVIGTILHYESLLSRLLANPAFEGRRYQGVIRWSEAAELWEQWENIYTDSSMDGEQRLASADRFYSENERAMTAGTQVIWPEYRSYYDLMKLRVAEGPASFDSEIQNEPVNPRDCLFREEWFSFFDEDEVDVAAMQIVAAVDPSLGGKGRHNDPSAVVCVGRDSAGVLYVLDADIERRRPDVIIEDVLELYARRKPLAVGVEAVQFQEFFKDVLLREAASRGSYPPVRGIKQHTDKLLRIQRLQPLVKSGRLKFQKKHRTLHDQLRFFPRAGHDDGPDALEMAVALMEETAGGERFRFDRPQTGKQQLERVFG
jgi:predicted phage terminase large subunit-like protein